MGGKEGETEFARPENGAGTPAGQRPRYTHDRKTEGPWQKKGDHAAQKEPKDCAYGKEIEQQKGNGSPPRGVVYVVPSTEQAGIQKRKRGIRKGGGSELKNRLFNREITAALTKPSPGRSP